MVSSVKKSVYLENDYFILFFIFSVFLLASNLSNAQSVSLTWNANTESDLAGYHVYRSLTSGSGFERLDSVLIPSPGFTDKTVKAGILYYYVVTAVNTSGLESGFSNQVSVVPRVENQLPQATDDSALTLEDTPLNISVLENDGGGGSATIVQISQPPSGQATILADGTIRFVPNPNFNGSTSFTYTIQGAIGGTSTALVTVTVKPVNDSPTAKNDSAATTSGRPVTIAVLANDFDVDGDVLTVSKVVQPSRGSVLLRSDGRVVFAPAPGFLGVESFSYTVSDPKGATASASVLVEVKKSESTSEPLLLPARLSESRQFFEDTFIGIALLNPWLTPNSIALSAVDSDGVELSSVKLAQIAPQGQLSFLSSEPVALTSSVSTLKAQGIDGPLQGFFLAGNMTASKLDGVGAASDSAARLFFPMAHQNEEMSTLLFLLNPSETPAFGISLRLFDRSGRLLDEQSASLEAGGSFSGTLKEVFETSAELEECYVEVNSSVALQGFEVVADERSFHALTAQPARLASRLFAPHFFVSGSSSDTSVLRLLNLESKTVQATVRAFDDSSQLLAEERLELLPGQLLARDLRQVLDDELSSLPSTAALTGFLEVDLSLPLGLIGPAVSSSVTFSTNQRQSVTTLPLVSGSGQEIIFPHVAQNVASQLFTGLSILNPGNDIAQVSVEVFDSLGKKTAERSFELAPKSRRIDLLNGEAFFGSSFEQMNGHIRLLSDQPVVAFAIFGSFQGDFLAAIEGQSPR